MRGVVPSQRIALERRTVPDRRRMERRTVERMPSVPARPIPLRLAWAWLIGILLSWAVILALLRLAGLL